MKNILVPTDFSACAGNAEAVAIQLASRFGAKVHFAHILSPGPYETEMTEWAEKKAGCEALLQEIARRYDGAATETACLEGPFLDLIELTVREKGIDLVVMGSHGSSGKSEYFIGSNTQRVVRRIHVPVLVIKDPIENLAFKNVVFASRFNESEREPFLRFKHIVKHFAPHIHLVAIHTSSFFEPPYIVTKSAMEEFQALCEPLSSEIHIFRELNIEEGIRIFSESVGADLIGISNYERHPIKRTLVGSNVEALVNHSALPVLTIDYES
jgi:nucleotide-binding universal stress UspA family protein